MSYQIELFHSLLSDFLQGEAALMTTEGDVLSLRGSNPVSYDTLVKAARTVTKYLKLAEGDIALLNDPYSGGTTLDEITFIMAVSEDLVWVNRRPLGKYLKLVKSVEEEGLRIPPTPLRQKGQLNEMILGAMSAHPACPPQFTEWVKAQCAEMIVSAQKLHDTIEGTGLSVTGDLIEEYVGLSKKLAVQRISEKASGETRVDVVLDSGELLRLNLEIQDGKVVMDFGGTSAAKTLHLTESATYGACFHAISKFYGFDKYSNSGSFSVLQVTKPAGCWLMAKYPASTLKGMTCGVAALQTAIDLALNNIHNKNEKALSSYAPLMLQLNHGASQAFLNIEGGQGATQDHDGQGAHIEGLSIETLERQLPVHVQRMDRRHSNGGKGKYSGGRGLIFKVEALEEIEASWLTDMTLHRPRLPKSCSHGDPCEVTLENGDSTKSLPVLGQQKIHKGEVLSLCSGTGGGYGRAETKVIVE
ncbi:hydantoinase B/oxoprolinase family protein [Bdellovibrio sp. SKB1291214]|uniref:hydantoinase B/oxoprolinase family protein n=1 Tax=Bdellovibrio sp. SKB1291214 TaxID=1732569 RepID=UPI000B5176C0|nr:hydantoinase B/oxoprolinase family protein [Bdellovibrio sp. SKB1291214]UYL09745.1 hydantoinase B/oxoprolinase family protein [Bdellovibrio sp. SKB1291214]